MADTHYSTDMDTPEATADEQMAEATLVEVGQHSPLRQNLLRGALIISLGAILTRILGVLRESVLSHIAGTGSAASAFTTAESTLNSLYDLLISGAISAALIPVLTHYAPRGKERTAEREEFGRLVSTLLTGGAILFGIVVVILEIFAAQLSDILAGSSATLQVQTLDLLRLFIPSFFFLGLSALLMGAHQSLQRFQYSALPAGARNGSVIVMALLFGTGVLGVNLGVSSLVLGVIIGSVIIVAIQLFGLRDIPLRPTLRPADWRHPAIRRILRLYVPIFLGLCVTTTSIIIDRNLTNGTSFSSAAAMRYATTLQQFALGLIAAAIAQAVLPNLSRAAAENDWANYDRTFTLGLRTLATLIFPATIALFALGVPTVITVFYGGKFDEHSLWLTYAALICYLPGLPAAAFDQMLIFGFYARKNALSPVLVGVGADVCLIAIEFAFVGPFGFIGLVLANSIRQIIHLLIMIVITRRWQRRHNASVRTPICRAFINIGLAAIFMGAAALLVGGLVLSALHGWGTGGNQSASRLSGVVALVCGGGFGAIAYIFALWRLGINDLTLIMNNILGRIRRK